jgi:hypothetical protein
MDNSRRARVNCWIVTGSADAKSANAIAMMDDFEIDSRLTNVSLPFNRTPARASAIVTRGQFDKSEALRLSALCR